MAPKVSVVMPAFNAADFVQAAVESILHQHFDDFELIIVEDGSSDRTWDILQACAQQDQRVRLLRNADNQGVLASRNRGLAAAQGEYLAVQDADDLSLPGRLAVQVTYLDQQPAVSAVGSPAQRIDAAGCVLSTWEVPQGHAQIRAHLLFTSPIAHTTMLARLALVRQVGGYQYEYGVEDYDLWWRLSKVGRLETIPQVLAQYRISDSPHRITSGQAPRQLQGSQEISLHIAQEITPPGTVDAGAYGRFFMSMRGRVQIQQGDMQRLQSLWDFLAADPAYRAITCDRLFTTSEKILRTHPAEAMYAVRVLRRQFGLPVTELARKYLYRARQRRS